jgi:ankyrin repeat protein
MLAAGFNDNTEVLTVLLYEGADLEAKTKQGFTPLRHAVQRGNPQSVSLLLQAGATVSPEDLDAARTNPKLSGTTIYEQLKKTCAGHVTAVLLETALDAGAEDVRRMIEAGAEVNARDGDGETPLTRAVMSNPDIQVVSLLIGAGADVNAKATTGFTPLRLAIINDNPEAASLLLQAGAAALPEDFDAVRQNSKLKDSAVYKELEKAHTAEMLLKTASHATPEEVSRLIKEGAQVNVRDQNEMSPLMLAAHFNDNPGVLHILISAGADIHAHDRHAQTALTLAASHNGNSEVLRTLIDLGAGASVKPGKGVKWFDLALTAARNPNPEVARILIEMGHDEKRK